MCSMLEHTAVGEQLLDCMRSPYSLSHGQLQNSPFFLSVVAVSISTAESIVDIKLHGFSPLRPVLPFFQTTWFSWIHLTAEICTCLVVCRLVTTVNWNYVLPNCLVYCHLLVSLICIFPANNTAINGENRLFSLS